MHLHEWLTENKIPESVVSLLTAPDFPHGREIGSVRFYTKSEIIEFNIEEEWLPKFLKHKLFAIADAINGDYWVLDFRSDPLRVAITPHDAEDPEGAIPDDLVAPIADSFEEFLNLASHDKLPIDYYAARKREK